MRRDSSRPIRVLSIIGGAPHMGGSRSRIAALHTLPGGIAVMALPLLMTVNPHAAQVGVSCKPSGS